MKLPHLGADVLFHFECRGGIRTRPAKVTNVEITEHRAGIPAPPSRSLAGFANMQVFFDGAIDGRTVETMVGWEVGVRMLKDGESPADRTWSWPPPPSPPSE